MARGVLYAGAMLTSATTQTAQSPARERRAPRWSTRIPVRYQVFDARSGALHLGDLGTSRASDIGPNGLFLSGVELPSGTPLHFFFELPETWGGCIEAFGHVVHARSRRGPEISGGHPVAGVGVRLLRISPGDRARLDRYLGERRAIDAACLSAAEVRVRAELHQQLRQMRTKGHNN